MKFQKLKCAIMAIMLLAQVNFANATPRNQNTATVQPEGKGLFTLLITQNGEVQAWGRNESGELGLGQTSQYEDTPQLIPNLTGVAQLSAGTRHAMALLNNGQVMVWGDNSIDQLGLEDEEQVVTSPTFIEIDSHLRTVYIEAGNDVSFAVLEDGAVKAWGNNSACKLGFSGTAGQPYTYSGTC